MADRPVLSVQIPVRDGGERFSETLRSLAGQETGGRRWELVVVDDGSRVPVGKDPAIDLSMPPGVDVRVVRRSGPGNRAAARNLAWRSAEAPLSLMADADLRFMPGALAGHMDLHREGGDRVVMGARLDAWRPGATPWQRWFDGRAMGGRPAGPFPWRYLITGNLSMPTALLAEMDGFDPAIDRYGGEDTELGYRLHLRGGVEMLWEPSLVARHLDEVTVRQHSRKMVEYGGSGLRHILEKHPGARGLLGSRWVEPLPARPLGPGVLAMRLLCRPALTRPVYRAALRAAELLGGPAVLFTYLSVGACLMGLRGRSFE